MVYLESGIERTVKLLNVSELVQQRLHGHLVYCDGKWHANGMLFLFLALSLSLTDDSISAASVSDMQDRLSSLELRVQQQEDELTVMKAALADVLRRLAQSEDMAGKKQQNTKGKRAPCVRATWCAKRLWL